MTKRKLLEILFEKYNLELYLYGIRLFGDDTLVEDAIQEVFLKLFKMDFQKLLKIENYDFYLRRALCNNYRNFFRKSKNFKTVSYNQLLDKRKVEQNVIEVLDANYAKTCIIRILSEREWKILELIYLEGLKYSEIEDILGMKKSSVARIVYRAKEKINKIL